MRPAQGAKVISLAIVSMFQKAEMAPTELQLQCFVEGEVERVEGNMYDAGRLEMDSGGGKRILRTRHLYRSA